MGSGAHSMALLYIWLPALIVGHLVAVVLFLYGAGISLKLVVEYWTKSRKQQGLPRSASFSDQSGSSCSTHKVSPKVCLERVAETAHQALHSV